jgi:hypothetical protein
MAAEAKSTRGVRLTGLFPDGESAERAYQACVNRGHVVGDVNVVVSEGTRKRLLAERDEHLAGLAERKMEGGELGGPSGGRVGILVTIFAAVGAAIAIPTVGFIAGPLAVALAAAGTAGVAASLISAFADWGVPADRVKLYEEGIRSGSILVLVEARSQAEAREIAEDWTRIGGRGIFYR